MVQLSRPLLIPRFLRILTGMKGESALYLFSHELTLGIGIEGRGLVVGSEEKVVQDFNPGGAAAHDKASM